MKSKIHINQDKSSIIKQHIRKQQSIITKTGITRTYKTVIDRYIILKDNTRDIYGKEEKGNLIYLIIVSPVLQHGRTVQDLQ